jgi:hypothetical protein
MVEINNKIKNNNSSRSDSNRSNLIKNNTSRGDSSRSISSRGDLSRSISSRSISSRGNRNSNSVNQQNIDSFTEDILRIHGNIVNFITETRNSKHSALKRFNDKTSLTDKDISIFLTELQKILEYITSYTSYNIQDIVIYFYTYKQQLPEDIDVLNYLRIELCKILKSKMDLHQPAIKYTIMSIVLLEKINEKLKELTHD